MSEAYHLSASLIPTQSNIHPPPPPQEVVKVTIPQKFQISFVNMRKDKLYHVTGLPTT